MDATLKDDVCGTMKIHKATRRLEGGKGRAFVQIAAHAGEVATVLFQKWVKKVIARGKSWGGILPLVAAPTVLFGGKQANTAPGTLLRPPLDEGHDPSLFQVPPPPIIGRSGGSLPCSEISVDCARK